MLVGVLLGARGLRRERARVVVDARERHVRGERQDNVERALQLARAPVGERGVEGRLGVVRVAPLQHGEVLGGLLVVGQRARVGRRVVEVSQLEGGLLEDRAGVRLLIFAHGVGEIGELLLAVVGHPRFDQSLEGLGRNFGRLLDDGALRVWQLVVLLVENLVGELALHGL